MPDLGFQRTPFFLGSFALRNVQTDANAGAVRQEDIGPRGIHDAAVPDADLEVGETRGRAADVVQDVLPVLGIGIERPERVTVAGALQRPTQDLFPVAAY